ncbi:hypothetical protein AK812_SmicGene11485 [Symbiodinium microadriaticum]|uniref:Apple domain-containing protein n=1 Tax=Symbiodinium microadriaticum TaxID=2951 RepID=A0A1Q9ECZ4_SYMMI|nr:hypothetical protein AK812_SmicGene11485 [Symbiodinium microadriaticum]
MAVMLGRCALLFCFLHVAWSQEADVTVTVVDISDQDVFLNIITAPEALPGLAWIFLTAPGAEPTPTEMKSGSGAVGPASCQDLADAITLPDATLGLVFCNLPYGAEYTLQAERLSGVLGGSWVVISFDIDYDYAGATVESNTTAADSVACQALCAASATCLHFRYVYDASSPDFQRCDLLSSGLALLERLTYC